MQTMDIQRLILLAIFFSSAFFLWSAWQQEYGPPPPPVAQTTTPAPGQPAAPAQDLPVPSTAPAPAATAGQKITIKTDLYTAEVDTLGGVISLVSLNKHQDATDPTKPYLALQRTTDRTFIAQAGLIGEGMPNHRTQYTAAPGPRELDPTAQRIELKLNATTPTGDKVVQVLTFHRGS